MTNKELLELMKEQFTVVSESIKEMEKRLQSRIDMLEEKIEPLVTFKDRSEGSDLTTKFYIGLVVIIVPIVISIASLYLTNK
jgi:hypothetical protein